MENFNIAQEAEDIRGAALDAWRAGAPLGPGVPRPVFIGERDYCLNYLLYALAAERLAGREIKEFKAFTVIGCEWCDNDGEKAPCILPNDKQDAAQVWELTGWFHPLDSMAEDMPAGEMGMAIAYYPTRAEALNAYLAITGKPYAE